MRQESLMLADLNVAEYHRRVVEQDFGLSDGQVHRDSTCLLIKTS